MQCIGCCDGDGGGGEVEGRGRRPSLKKKVGSGASRRYPVVYYMINIHSI